MASNATNYTTTAATTIAMAVKEEWYGSQVTGSLVLDTVIIILIFGATVYLVKYYAENSAWKTHKFYIVLTATAWSAGFVGTAYLPFDIALTQASGMIFEEGACQGVDEESCTHHWEDDLETAWTALFWFTFIFTWLVLPIFMEIYNAAEFTFAGRLCFSLKAQLKFYAMAIAGGIVVGVIFYALDPSEEFSNSMMQALMALGNAYGLLIVVALLGDGLIRVPKELWISANPVMAQEILCAVASDHWSKLTDKALIDELTAAVTATMEMKQQLEAENTESFTIEGSEFEEEFNLIFEPLARRKRGLTHVEIDEQKMNDAWNQLGVKVQTNPPWTGSPTKAEKLVKLQALHQQTKHVCQKVLRRRGKWISTVRDYRFYLRMTDVHKAHGDQEAHSFRPNCEEEPISYFLYYILCCCLCGCKCAQAVVLSLRTIFLRIVAILAFSFSLLVISAELTVAADGQQSVFGLLIKDQENEVAIFLVMLLTYGYICFCVYRSFLAVNFFSALGLANDQCKSVSGDHYSDVYGLMFFGAYLCRMQFSLGYHYLNILQYKGEPQNLQPSAFKRLYLANGDVSGLGIDWFFAVFPTLVVVMFILTAVDAYARIRRCCGFKASSYDEYIADGKDAPQWANGKTKLMQEARALKKKEELTEPTCCFCFKPCCQSDSKAEEKKGLVSQQQSTAEKNAKKAGQKIRKIDEFGKYIDEKPKLGAAPRKEEAKVEVQNREIRRIPQDIQMSQIRPPRLATKKVGTLLVKEQGGGWFSKPQWIEHYCVCEERGGSFIMEWWKGGPGDKATGNAQSLDLSQQIVDEDVADKEQKLVFSLSSPGAKAALMFAEGTDSPSKLKEWISILKRGTGATISNATTAAEQDPILRAVMHMEVKGMFSSSLTYHNVTLEPKTKTFRWTEGVKKGERQSDKGAAKLDLDEFKIRSFDGVDGILHYPFELIHETKKVSYKFGNDDHGTQNKWLTEFARLRIRNYEVDMAPPRKPSGGGSADIASVLVEPTKSPAPPVDALRNAFEDDGDDSDDDMRPSW